MARQSVLSHESFSPLLRQFRHFRPDLFGRKQGWRPARWVRGSPLRNANGRQIRLRKIAVIMGLFFGTLAEALFFKLIPASGFLFYLFSGFQQLSLPFYFIVNRVGRKFNRINILNLYFGAPASIRIG